MVVVVVAQHREVTLVVGHFLITWQFVCKMKCMFCFLGINFTIHIQVQKMLVKNGGIRGVRAYQHLLEI